MKVRISIAGTSPLLMHNIQLADPDNDIVREIATYTGKRKRTEDDRRAIARLEWYGGLYLGASGPAMPTGNIRKALINAAKITKQGTAVQRALHFTDIDVPLVYDGSRDIDVLFKNPAHHHRAAVGIGNKRTMRDRPKFSEWAVVADAEFLEDVLDLSDFVRVVERAGLAEGLGDGRALGFGRFEGKVEEQ